MREARVGIATRREAENGVTDAAEREVEPLYDERAGYCWRCSHLTDAEDRTCSFCLSEINPGGPNG